MLAVERGAQGRVTRLDGILSSDPPADPIFLFALRHSSSVLRVSRWVGERVGRDKLGLVPSKLVSANFDTLRSGTLRNFELDDAVSVVGEDRQISWFFPIMLVGDEAPWLLVRLFDLCIKSKSMLSTSAFVKQPDPQS